MQGMMAQFSLPIRGLPGYLHRVRSDSLVRNSLYLMASTIVTAGLGYIFWAFAAHAFTRQEVGIGSAIISLCSTAALFTYLGSFAMLIQRLPASEHSSRWTATLITVCSVTAMVTAATIVVAVPLLRTSNNYRWFFSSSSPILVAVVGASAWTLVNLLGAAFIAARRAGRLLSIQTLVSVAKVLLVFPLAAAGIGATGLVDAWVASSVLGVIVGVVWLVPRMGLGQRSGLHPHRREAVTPHFQLHQYRHPRHRRGLVPPSGRSALEWLGQHLTSAGGVLVPLILPILVVLRLGVVQNAYFYITEMMGAAFFMVSPSVAQAVFAEGVRAHAELRSVVVKALRVIATLLAPAMAIMILGGRPILRLFGTSYAAAGYALLVLLAISAVPDAVSNVAVAVCRVTHRLGYSTVLNLGILVMTLSGAWFLMPLLGITGVGVAWLGAQTIGAIASLPAFAYTGKPLTLSPASPGRAGAQPGETLPDPGIALLIEIAKQQSLPRLNNP
jgi:O-antigen/teichoic acid export membrane protein